MNSPVSYYGGKARMRNDLLPLFPEHSHYVEPYCGGAWLFFAKRPSLLETLNDVNDGVTNFYRVLRDNPAELLRLIEFTPYSRRDCLECQSGWQLETDPTRKAWMWYMASIMAFSGTVTAGWHSSVTATRRGMCESTSKAQSKAARLPEAHARLKSAQIENKNALDVIRQYDRQETFFYLDPPYIADTRRAAKAYVNETDDVHHRDLVSLLLTIRGKAMLSGYRHSIYEPLEADGWRTKDFDKAARAQKKDYGKNGATAKHRRTETVWMNYDPPVNRTLFGNMEML